MQISIPYIFVKVDAPLRCVAIQLEVLEERRTAVSVRELREVQLHVEEAVDFGEQRSQQRNQEGVGVLCLLLDGALQNALHFS